MTRTITWTAGAALALVVLLAPANALAVNTRFSAEGFGGFGLYYDSGGNSTGYAAGGALGLGFGGEDLAAGLRVQSIFVKTDLSAFSVTGGPFLEFGNPGSVTGYAYLGLGYGQLDFDVLIFNFDFQGFVVELGAGGRVFVSDNVFLMANLNLARGTGDINAVNFSINGGLGVEFY